jgi:hypothetical protein
VSWIGASKLSTPSLRDRFQRPTSSAIVISHGWAGLGGGRKVPGPAVADAETARNLAASAQQRRTCASFR